MAWNTQKKAYIGLALLAIGLCFLTYLISRIGIEAIKVSLEEVKPSYLLYGLLTALLSLIVRAYKWHIALRQYVKTNCRYVDTMLIYFSNFIISYFTPVKSGELLAPLFFRQVAALEYNKGFSIIVVDRFLELVIMLSLVVVSLLYLVSARSGMEGLSVQLSTVMVFLGGVVLLLIIASTKKNGKKIIEFVNKSPKLDWLYPTLYSFYDNIQLLKSKIKILTFFTMLAWIIDSMTFYFLFNSIIDISYIKAAVVEFISTCVGVLTFIPGGIGVSEFSTVLLLQKMGFDLTLATTAGILIRFPMLLVLVLGFLEIIYIFFLSKKTGMDPS